MKKSTAKDWSAARIGYELKRRGLSFRELERQHGYAARSLWNVTRAKSRRAEAIVAAAIGVRPRRIWPSRYPRQAQA